MLKFKKCIELKRLSDGKTLLKAITMQVIEYEFRQMGKTQKIFCCYNSNGDNFVSQDILPRTICSQDIANVLRNKIVAVRDVATEDLLALAHFSKLIFDDLHYDCPKK
uniref:Uncharacterized protein n=1 Tax=Acrobeloides nanus TaxID=290746 RepID=A0A914E7P3_9BILA